MSHSDDATGPAVTRRGLLTTTALAAGAMALPRGAFAVEDEFAATSGEKVYFRGWQYKPDVVQDNVDRYNKLHTGKVDYQTVTGDYPAIMEKSLITGDALDMIYANPPTAVRFMEAGWIKPADDLISGPAAIADMYDKVREAWTHKGKVLGLSYFLSPRGIVVVNRKKQEELGIKDEDLPKTWDEFYTHIDALAAKGAKDIYLPHWFNEYYGISWAFLWEVINRGGTTVDPKTRAPTVSVDTPPARHSPPGRSSGNPGK
jgi:multiple sugar transport system substrate-binding protein